MTVNLNILALKKNMAKQRMTNVQLAKLSGISEQSISAIFRRGNCSVPSAGLIAAALQVDLVEIWKEE